MKQPTRSLVAMITAVATAGPACVAPEPGPDTAQTAAKLATDSGRLVETGWCDGVSDCATEVPRTGRISPLFREVDIAMAQFMKTHCVGAAVLAISRKGKLVYKRGFGRTHGAATSWSSADCPQDAWDDGGEYVTPDTPMPVGSVSKFVTGTMARKLVWQRIVDKGMTGTYADPSEAKLLDPTLELLPPSLLRYYDQTREDAECPPLVLTDIACTTRTGCGGNGPDSRWTRVTIGDLLGHSAGLPWSAPDWYDVLMPNVATLRGHDDEADWQAEHDVLRASTPYQAAMDEARGYLAGRLDVDESDLYFVNPYHRVAGENPLDDVMRAVAGRCLAATPKGQSDSFPKSDTGYSNTGYAILDRVIAHLAPELGAGARFAAPDGAPELHQGSALDLFLAAEGIEYGIETEEGIYAGQKLLPPGYVDPAPQPRAWDGETYYWLTNSVARPFCVWNDAAGTCDMGPWKDDIGGAGGLRLPWDFLFWQWAFTDDGPVIVEEPPQVGFMLQTPSLGAGTGGLRVEAPVLLDLLGRYYAQEKDVRMGRERATCPECDDTAGKNGGMTGAYAWVYQLAGDPKAMNLPPTDADGRLTIERDTSQWVSTSWTDPDEVDFVVAINQSADETGGGSYASIGRYVRFGLDKVDWMEVDRWLDTGSVRIAGMAFNSKGNTYYWYEDGIRAVRDSDPGAHHGDWATLSSSTYALPSARPGSSIVGVGIDSKNRVHAWYDDGHVSTGTSNDLASVLDPQPYTLPPGQTFEDILGVSINSGNRVYSWYRDGTVATGTSIDLGRYGTATFELPPGQAWDDVVDMAIDWPGGNHVWTRFRDGTVTEGTTQDLDAHGLWRGRVDGLSSSGDRTTIWYRSGFRRVLDGMLADNLDELDVLEVGWWDVAPFVDREDLLDVAESLPTQGVAWFDGGVVATSGGHLDGGWVGGLGFPAGQDAGTVAGIAQTTDGIVYSWYLDGTRAIGTATALAATSTGSFTTPPGQSPATIEAIAIASGGGDGRVWTLYQDGSVSEGRSWDLDYYGYWPAP